VPGARIEHQRQGDQAHQRAGIAYTAYGFCEAVALSVTQRCYVVERSDFGSADVSRGRAAKNGLKRSERCG